MMINHSTVENHVTKKPQFYWSMCERAANSFTNNLVTARAINSNLSPNSYDVSPKVEQICPNCKHIARARRRNTEL